MKFATTYSLIFSMALSLKEASAVPQGIRGRKMMESKEKGNTQSDEQRDLQGNDLFCFEYTNPSHSTILIQHWDADNIEVFFKYYILNNASHQTCVEVHPTNTAISLTFVEGDGDVDIFRQTWNGNAIFGDFTGCLGLGNTCLSPPSSMTFYRSGELRFGLPKPRPTPVPTPSTHTPMTPRPTPGRPTPRPTPVVSVPSNTWEFCFDCSHPDVVLYHEQATKDNIIVEWLDASGQPHGDRDILGGCSGQKCLSKPIQGELKSVQLKIQGGDAVLIDHATLKKNDNVSQQFGEHGGSAYCLSKNEDDNEWFRDILYNTVAGRCSDSILFENGEINNLH